MKYFKDKGHHHYYMKHKKNAFIHINNDLINIISGDDVPDTINTLTPVTKEEFMGEYTKVLMKVLPDIYDTE